MPIQKDDEFAEMVGVAIPQNKDLAKSNLAGALENLMALEKQTRLAGDASSTAKLAVAVVQVCREAGDWKLLNEYVVLVSKRRAQHKQAVTKMVQECVPYVDQTPDMDTKLELISTLRLVSEGKIHVEIERARLTRVLAKIKEDEGKISEAAELLQEVQVETYGSMEKREKTEFILEQCRLCLDSKDYVRALIITRKVSPKTFPANGDLDDLKVTFHQLLVRYHSHFRDYLDIARSYNAICGTKPVRDDADALEANLRLCCIYAVLAPFDSEQSDLLHRVAAMKKMEDLPLYADLAQQFTTRELLRWPDFMAKFGDELKTAHKDIFGSGDDSAKFWDDLKLRVIEHNIRVLAEYYKRITLKRTAALLDLSEADSEKHLCDLVVKKTIYAKVDRPAGIITFQRPQAPAERLSDWSADLGKLLELVDSTCHIINKEQMLHAAKK